MILQRPIIKSAAELPGFRGSGENPPRRSSRVECRSSDRRLNGSVVAARRRVFLGILRRGVRHCRNLRCRPRGRTSYGDRTVEGPEGEPITAKIVIGHEARAAKTRPSYGSRISAILVETDVVIPQIEDIDGLRSIEDDAYRTNENELGIVFRPLNDKIVPEFDRPSAVNRRRRIPDDGDAVFRNDRTFPGVFPAAATDEAEDNRRDAPIKG